MAEDPQCFAVRKQTTLTSPSLGLAAARNAFSVSLRTKKGPKKSAVPRNTTLSGSGSCKECLPCCFHIQTGPPTRARCLKIRPSVAFAPAGNAFPISRQVSKERLLGVSPGQKRSLFAVVGTKKPKVSSNPTRLSRSLACYQDDQPPIQAWTGLERMLPQCPTLRPPCWGGLLTRTLPGMQLSECGRREGTMPPVRTPRCGAQRATVANSCCSTGPHPAMDGHA